MDFARPLRRKSIATFVTERTIRTMKKTASLALLAGLLLAPAAASAQTPYFGAALGVQSMPDDVDACTNAGRTALEARGGLARGAFALEARVTGAAQMTGDMCLFADNADLFVPANGTFTTVEYPFDRGDGHVAADLRVRWGGTPALPFTLSAGGGYTPTYDLPYVLAGVGVRTGGRLRLAVDVEREWYRVESEVVTTRWENSQPVAEISRVSRDEWTAGMGVRVGLELAVH
jgi:hypothetical protein